MSATEHPFSHDRVEAVAAERGVETDVLDEALDRVQRAIASDDGDAEYEYSSRHNYGWEDDEAYYLYGDGIWASLGEELPLADDLAAAARDVHRRAMLASAAERDELDAVEEQFAEGTEPLVVTNTSDGSVRFGQDV